jgi:hypothetical protein
MMWSKILAAMSAVLWLLPAAFGQNMERVRKNIEQLCAPTMHGRGYVQNGSREAAFWIAQQMKQLGLQPVGASFMQDFPLEVNTFPGKMDFFADKLKLLPGHDYLVEAASPTTKGRFELVRPDTALFSRDFVRQQTAIERLLSHPPEGKALLLTAEQSKALQDLPATALTALSSSAFSISEHQKLTMNVSPMQNEKPHFQVLKGKIPPQAKYIKTNIEAQLLTSYTAYNVIGQIRGKTRPDSVLVFSAHYDHLGRMGKDCYFPGANDNASGVSMLLELADYYVQHPPDYTIVFMAFGAEEIGLVGSKWYVENPLFPLAQIRFLVNLDLVGTGNDGLTAVNATVFPQAFERLRKIALAEGFPEVKARGKAANSDHYFFTEAGVPSFFIYALGGTQAYHDVHDRAATLPLTRYEALFRTLTAFVGQW